MRKILISGGGLENKGAQAMLFICVDELSKKFPEHEIIAISDSDCEYYEKHESIYRFRFIRQLDYKYALYKMGGPYGLLMKLKGINQEMFMQIDELMSDVDLLVDISGYALSSSWDYHCNMLFLSNFIFSKAYGFNSYVMPQSFGPFDYKGIKGKAIEFFIKHFLQIPKVIYAREKSGYDLLKNKYKIINLQLSCDMVLKNKMIESNQIYKVKDCKTDSMKIDRQSVGIVPNIQNFRYISEREALEIYKAIIVKLLLYNKSVYILRHSNEDYSLCKKIKALFLENNKVITLVDDYDCFQLNSIIKRFDYMIASRYHSIVHAYKNSVPCLTIGWSNKYHDLLSLVDQDKYMVDIRNQIDTNQVIEKLSELNDAYFEERTILSNKLMNLQSQNLFCDIKID